MLQYCVFNVKVSVMKSVIAWAAFSPRLSTGVNSLRTCR